VAGTLPGKVPATYCRKCVQTVSDERIKLVEIRIVISVTV